MMDLIERLHTLINDRCGDGPSGPNYDPELLEVLSEAAAALEAARADAWQPIETAPKDGGKIWVNDTSGLTSFCVAYWLSGYEWSGWVYEEDLWMDSNPLGPNPTHWRPLGEPPALAQQPSVAPVGVEALLREYRPSMDAEVLHAWAKDVVAALTAQPGGSDNDC